MKKICFEEKLPDNYKEVYVVDAERILYLILFNLTCFVIGMSLILIFTYITKVKFWEINTVYLFIFSLSLVLYIVMHELVHGLFYKIFTKKKLSFGFSLTYAYCGVPNLYVYRKYALITVLAPFVVFNIIPIFLLFVIEDISIRYLVLVFISIHISGCVGDLFCAFLLLFKFKDPLVLINDTGLKQIFYSNK